jgi:CHAD domain-containing protein
MLRALRAQATLWQSTASPDALHDLRVAARRYRTALRLFRPLLDPPAARAMDARLRMLAGASGPARDRDVADALAGAGNTRPTGEERRRLRRFLAGREFRELLRDAETQDLALRSRRSDRAPDFPSLVAQRLSVLYRKLTSLRPLHRMDEADYLHRCRKMARRLRYVAESAAGSQGKAMREFAALLHPLTTALGNVHDIDVASHLRRRAAGARLRAARDRHTAQVRRAWKRVTGRQGRRLLAQTLNGTEEA